MTKVAKVAGSDDIIVNADAKIDADRLLIGGKGASLFWMSSLGLPVPPFFVLTTRAWREWREAGQLPESHVAKIMEMIRWLEGRTGRTFGGDPRPLLVSVRSAGPVSMPGMMDTILNLGLTPDALAALSRELGSLQVVADVIMNFVGTATPVFVGNQDAVGMSLPLIPASAEDQLLGAIEGVFASWNNQRARLYRRINRIPDDYGTAVVVQAMVFGNAGDSSGTGVLFTRDPVNGDSLMRGEWVPAAQGEVIVSGRTTPVPIEALRTTQPAIYQQLRDVASQLERGAREPQDIEFTVERGRLYLLQTRTLKSAPLASCKTALDFLDEGLISQQEAVERLSLLELPELATDTFTEPPAAGAVLATGLAACPGIVYGVVVREIDAKSEAAPGRESLVLLRPETSPHDLPAMRRASALITEHGGLTSHAAIVARELKIPCVVGCGELSTVREGQEVTVDGTSGVVYLGRLMVVRVVPEVVRRAQCLLSSRESGAG
jgi:pyruvate, orthophosphate dikinase